MQMKWLHQVNRQDSLLVEWQKLQSIIIQIIEILLRIALQINLGDLKYICLISINSMSNKILISCFGAIIYIMSVQQLQNGEESFTNQKQKIQGGRSSIYEIKIPDLQFINPESPNVNFQLQVCRLVQANAILTELIKQAALEKYNLSEKIHLVLQQIKKLQAKNAAK